MESDSRSMTEPAMTTEAVELVSDDRDEYMSPDELGLVIDDLRAGRRPAILEDQEP